MAVEHTEKYGSDITFYANLYPNTATGTFGGKSFDGYVGDFCDNILSKVEGRKIVSCDIYPLMKTASGPAMRESWLAGIETVAKHTKRIGGEAHFFLQATEHYSYRAVTEEDLRFQFYVNMAFGVKGFSYFTYRSSFLPDFQKSCVDNLISGKTYPLYGYAKTVNAEMQAFDHVYLSFDWNGTMPVLGELNEEGYNMNFDGLVEPKSSLDCLKNVTAEQDALIGQFKDADGNDGLIVTNFTDPDAAQLNYVTLKFKNASKAIVYRKGIRYAYEVKNNELGISLDSGEGVFVVPVK